MTNWKPIETAPNNVPILTFYTGFGVCVDKQYHDCTDNGIENYWEMADQLYADHNELDYPLPTHWMPLPDQPKDD
jgi:hypothetical protein